MHFVLILLTALGGVYLLICGIIWRWQERLTFFPSPTIAHFPQEYGLNYEDAWLPIPDTDGDRLHGWWLPAPEGLDEAPTQPSVVLLLHGNGFNIGANLSQARVFHQLGHPVFMVDYRGYGQSSGPFATEQQVYADAQIALDYLVRDRGIPPQHIIVFGHSLGGAITIELATHNPDLAALIIQGSFTSLRDMIDYDGIYGWLPLDLIVRQFFDSFQKVPTLKMPLFFVHGDGDRRVPSCMSERLYDVATTTQKELYILLGVDHNHVPEMGGTDYQDRLKEFLDQLTVRSA